MSGPGMPGEREGGESGRLGDPGPVTASGTAGASGPVLVLFSADWAGPSRPAPTVLRELARRWTGRVVAVLIEDPSEEVLEDWGVTTLPTWIRCDRFDEADGPPERVAQGAPPSDGAAPALGAPDSSQQAAGAFPGREPGHERDGAPDRLREAIRGEDVGGESVLLPGPWVETHRLRGARPKHEVAALFDPEQTRPEGSPTSHVG